MEHINQVILLGNLTRDPEVQPIGNSQLCKFTLAVNGIPKDGQPDVLFMDITTWGDLAAKAATLHKGQQCTVTGRLKQDKWQDKTTGVERSKYNVVATEVVV